MRERIDLRRFLPRCTFGHSLQAVAVGTDHSRGAQPRGHTLPWLLGDLEVGGGQRPGLPLGAAGCRQSKLHFFERCLGAPPGAHAVPRSWRGGRWEAVELTPEARARDNGKQERGVLSGFVSRWCPAHSCWPTSEALRIPGLQRPSAGRSRATEPVPRKVTYGSGKGLRRI